MRQVPNNKKYNYLFVGNGKVSRHFQFYFRSLNIPFKVWTKSSSETFEKLVTDVQKILILIKDDEIENFIISKKTGQLESKIFIHFSGILSLSNAESAHPLMTFGNELYDIKIYKEVPFITEEGKNNFKDLFPELPNKSFQISPEIKPLYHAFCVMSGNFTTILWRNFFNFLSTINIPQDVSYPYMERVFANLKTSDQPLTGPLERNDMNTISKHLKSINNDAMKKIYLSFLELYHSELEEKVREKHK